MNPSALFHRLAIAALAFTGLHAAAQTVQLVPQEQAIANDMTSDPNQGRPQLILDPIIEKVARARAQDMAVRNYFSHVNPDGVAANYLLRQAGYQLPSWWGTDPTDNYVESIAAGYSSASDTWTQWMNSPPHKVHLLGQNSFFATETHYGVGYYADPNSQYQYYWVVITAPPAPIEVFTPEPGASVATSSVALSGWTDPATNPATVQYCVINTGGTSAWQAANGIARWTGTASLLPGANTIHVQSLDGSGNVIDDDNRTVNFVEQGSLAVSVSGSGTGTVTAGLSGTTTHDVGVPVTIRAKAAAGYVFTGWTGSVTSGSATLTFTMQNTVDLQANFSAGPYLAVTGAYYGVVTSGSSAAPDGFLQLSMLDTGRFTGRVFVSGSSWSFSGQLDSNGDATITIPGNNPLTINLQADLTGGSGQITGTVTDGDETFNFGISQSTYNARTNAAPQAGRYTLVLPPDPTVTGSSAPQGSGYAAIVIKPNGTATINGRLADGTPYSHTAHLANDGTLSVYFVPSGAPKGSSVNGILTFAATDTSDVSGTLSWTQGASTANPYYPSGFSEQMPCVGSRYAAPATASGMQSMDIPTGPATAGLGDGNLDQPLTVPVTITAQNTAVMANPGAPNLAFSINKTSGVITGAFLMPDGNVTRAVRGIVLQKQQSAYGFFRGLTEYGAFSVSQVP
ncbi:MAG TPA: CAP domain-containing protein [Chthoniobacteraceae bacterium]|nr:CAP domain-containing protein [Chthoniobacteraceae bacterium]